MHVYKKFGKIGRQTNRQIGQLLSNYEMCSWLFKKKAHAKNSSDIEFMQYAWMDIKRASTKKYRYKWFDGIHIHNSTVL